MFYFIIVLLLTIGFSRTVLCPHLNSILVDKAFKTLYNLFVNLIKNNKITIISSQVQL